jgi:hypothetical protein
MPVTVMPDQDAAVRQLPVDKNKVMLYDIAIV